MADVLGPIRHIAQRQESDCTVAAAAMVVGCSYHEMDTLLMAVKGIEYRDPFSAADASIRMMHWEVVERVWRLAQTKDGRWPPGPFAERHLCLVETTTGHAVAMDADGTVYDPLTSAPKKLTDYEVVSGVIGYKHPND